MRAIARARASGADVGLTIVCKPADDPVGELPDWVRIVRAEGREIHALLPNVMALVIPRPRTPYNDIVLPIKLFDYLSYGRPLLVTSCAEVARVVEEAGCGLVVDDDESAIAGGIRELLSMSTAQRARLARAAATAAAAMPWEARARDVLSALGIGRATA